MLETKRITWTDAPAESVLDALYELDSLEQDEQSPDAAAHQAQIDTLRTRLAGENAHDTRYTLTALSVLTKSRYFANVRSIDPWLNEQWPDEDDPERVRVALMAYSASLVLASLTSTEKRDRALLDADNRDGWEPTSTPAEWATVQTYLNSTPPALHDALTAAAHALNPQMLVRGSNEQAKKFGGVSGS